LGEELYNQFSRIDKEFWEIINSKKR